MRFIVITIFPEIFKIYFETGLPKKSIDKGLINYELINLRDISSDKHKKVDDYTYGGGTGMVFMFPVLKKAVEKAKELSNNNHIILLSPSGIKYDQNLAKELSKHETITLICAHYEGCDERIKNFIDEEISVGDFITQGGEIPALILIDTISRFIPGFLKKEEAVNLETFSENLVEYPQYTRPNEYEGLEVPDILLSGNHEKVRLYRKKESLKRTLLLRPDLLLKRDFDEEEKKLLIEIEKELIENIEKILKR